MAVILSTLQGKIILYMPGKRKKLPNDVFKRCKCNTVMIRYIFCDGTNA